MTLAKKTQCHVPYRNSKLTYLLQDSLSRAARVLMVVNISPLEADAVETICSLAFAARCRDVELGAALARPEAAELARAKQEIRALKARLDRLAARGRHCCFEHRDPHYFQQSASLARSVLVRVQ